MAISVHCKAMVNKSCCEDRFLNIAIEKTIFTTLCSYLVSKVKCWLPFKDLKRLTHELKLIVPKRSSRLSLETRKAVSLQIGVMGSRTT